MVSAWKYAHLTSMSCANVCYCRAFSSSSHLDSMRLALCASQGAVRCRYDARNPIHTLLVTQWCPAKRLEQYAVKLHMMRAP
eukprot:3193322-Lingulodinium_polyedra.AAC.1